MPRGGARPGAGRPRKTPAAPVKAKAKPGAKKAAKAAGRGFTLPNGEKAPDAPPGWPFGTQPPVAAAEPQMPPDPDRDDGLTDEQRAGLAPLDYLLAVMRSPKASKSARLQAAIQAAPYVHAKPAPKGKKEGQLEDAKKRSRFAQAAPPKLVAAGGKKL